MTIISCIKQVQDLDMVLTKDWFIQEDGRSIDISYANKIMNTYDETALELMLRLVDAEDKTNTYALTVGDISKETILRKALAVGVQHAIRIDTEDKLEQTPLSVSRMIATAIKDIDDVMLVLCGRQADNFSHGITGQLLAEELGWPCFTMVAEISHVNGIFHLERVIEEGIEHINVKGPIVVTITQSENKFLRMATLKNTMEAKKKEINIMIHESSNQSYKDCLAITELRVNKPAKQCIYLKDKPGINTQEQLEKLLVGFSRNRGTL